MKKNMLRELFGSLSRFELGLWIFSVIAVTLSFILGTQFMVLTLIASLVGVTSLIFIAKGNVWGQVLMLIFSLLYAVISYKERYYGEMITYVLMTAPAALMSTISWLRHPFKKGVNEVKVASLNGKKIAVMLLLSVAVTAVFYYILKFFNTANLVWSTVSITTSFIASYLTFMRSSYYALAYAANDIILIILWVTASVATPGNTPMIACFAVFFINDMYGFFSWRSMQKKQSKGE